jgi:Skp family chaperone for outer membrane proteins
MAIARAFALLFTVLACMAGTAGAQDAARGATVASPFLTLDQERVYTGSLWGQRAEAQITADAAALAAESASISDALTIEERSLTERRATMPAEDFRVEADAFDARVTAIRREQDAKSRDLARRAEAERLAYFDAILDAIRDVMRERGAVAILNRNAIFVAADSIDVTDAVIARADLLVGAGPAPLAPDAPVPAVPAPAAPAGDGN